MGGGSIVMSFGNCIAKGAGSRRARRGKGVVKGADGGNQESVLANSEQYGRVTASFLPATQRVAGENGVRGPRRASRQDDRGLWT